MLLLFLPLRVNHLIALPVHLISQQQRALRPCNRQPQHLLLRPVRQMRRQHASLAQRRGLVPPDVLVREPVASDVDDGEHRDLEGTVAWWDVGHQPWNLRGVSAAEDELVCIQVQLLVSGFDLLWVAHGTRRCRLKGLPTIRSGPIVREIGLRVVSGGLL